MNANKEELKEQISSLAYSYDVTEHSSDIHGNYGKYEGKIVCVAGRVMAIRKAGKLLFLDILDSEGKIQAYFEYTKLGEDVFNGAKKINPGDIIGVSGTVFKTKAGEPSVNVASFALLSKAIINLPDKWHGVVDSEKRYRKRYLDLIMNEDSRRIFKIRSMAVFEIRRFLNGEGFMEHETPTIQPLYGGADAEPFRVDVNTLKEEHYLRISDELYLKRLIIAGMERVYEICKDFRNEDIDSTHSPEFTMIEIYQAYVDYNAMMDLTERMLKHISSAVLGKTSIERQGTKIELSGRYARIKYMDSIGKALGIDISKQSDEEIIAMAENRGIRFDYGKRNIAHALDKLFSLLIQPSLIQPTFVVDFPKSSSPLTREKRKEPGIVERFELYIAGMEIANSYSELNNPIIQKENFDKQMEQMRAGDSEAEPLDLDFLEAMEYGMPPTGGIGIGIDRLIMIMANVDSIKEVILFPMEKRGKSVLDEQIKNSGKSNATGHNKKEAKS